MRNCGCGCNTFQSGEICRFHHDFFCFSPQPAATKTHQFRLNRLRSAIQYVGQAHTSLNTERSAGTAFKTKSGAQGGAVFQSGNEGKDPREAARAPRVRRWEPRALPLCLSSPSSCSSPSPAATGFSLHCSLKLGSERAARPSTRSRGQELPLKLQRIITTSCSRRLAGQLCKQAS